MVGDEAGEETMEGNRKCPLKEMVGVAGDMGSDEVDDDCE
jgi:hypothetical protein